MDKVWRYSGAIGHPTLFIFRSLHPLNLGRLQCFCKLIIFLPPKDLQRRLRKKADDPLFL